MKKLLSHKTAIQFTTNEPQSCVFCEGGKTFLYKIHPVGLNCSSLFHPKKKSPAFWLDFFGAGDEARTRYLHLGKVALYRMSYTRGTGVLYQISRKCQEGFPRYTKNLGIIPSSLLTVLSFSRRKRDLLGAAAWYWAGLFFRKHKQVLN